MVILFIGDDEFCHVIYLYVKWVINLTASYHVTPRKEFFTSYKVGNLGRAKMSNESCAHIAGIGDICMKSNTGCSLTLKDVRHVPHIRLSLISICALDVVGYNSHLGNDK